MAEQYLPPEHPIVQAFIELPVDGEIELPLDVLTPITIYGGKSSLTPNDPIEVYLLRCTRAPHIGELALWISDGHHRYYKALLHDHAHTINARKIIPDPDHDVRIIFGAAAGKKCK